VLAVDAPTLCPADLIPLLQSSTGACFDGLPLPLVAPLTRLVEAAPHDWPLKRLVERAGLDRLPPPPAALLRLRGANTPSERLGLIQDMTMTDTRLFAFEDDFGIVVPDDVARSMRSVGQVVEGLRGLNAGAAGTP